MKTEVESQEQKQDKFKELKENTAFLGAIVDTAHTQYQTEWQRIGNMQQSAGALVTSMTIIYSALLALVILLSGAPSTVDGKYLNQVILPTSFVGIFFLVLTTYFFFRVIWPRDLKGLATPLDIFSQINNKELWKNLADLIKRLNGSIKDLHNHVQLKQLYYKQALICCSTSFAITLIVLLLILFKLSWVSTILLYYYFVLAAIALIVLIIVFKRRIKHAA